MTIGLERPFTDRSGYFDRHKTLSRFLALCLLSAALGLNIAGLYRVGHTSDEWQHYLFGKQWTQGEILERRGFGKPIICLLSRSIPFPNIPRISMS